MGYVTPMITCEYAEYQELQELKKYKLAVKEMSRCYKDIPPEPNIPTSAGGFKHLAFYEFKNIIEKYNLDLTK